MSLPQLSQILILTLVERPRPLTVRVHPGGQSRSLFAAQSDVVVALVEQSPERVAVRRARPGDRSTLLVALPHVVLQRGAAIRDQRIVRPLGGQIEAAAVGTGLVTGHALGIEHRLHQGPKSSGHVPDTPAVILDGSRTAAMGRALGGAVLRGS